MHDDDTAGSTCAGPMPNASPARGQSSVGQRNPAASMSRRDRSPVGNVGGEGSREPLQGLDGVCRRVSRGSARSLAHGAVCVPQTKRWDAAEGAICSVVVHTRLFDGAKVVFFFVAIRSETEIPPATAGGGGTSDSQA